MEGVTAPALSASDARNRTERRDQGTRQQMATTHTQHSAHHQDHAVAHHDHGTMDVTDHQRTFDGFIRLMTWFGVGVVVLLIFLALANA